VGRDWRSGMNARFAVASTFEEERLDGIIVGVG